MAVEACKCPPSLNKVVRLLEHGEHGEHGGHQVPSVFCWMPADAPPTQPHEQQQSLLDHVLAKQHLSEQDDEAQDDEASKDGSSLLMSVIQQTSKECAPEY